MILDINSFFLLILGDTKLADRFWWLVISGKLKLSESNQDAVQLRHRNTTGSPLLTGFSDNTVF